jgi:quinol monooxygenase YgiN
MAVTEVALLRILPGGTAEDPKLRSNLAYAKDVMQRYTNNTFYYFQQIEDPSYIYIIGEWESLDQHMNRFIPSAGNQALLERLKDQLTVEWLLHADVSHASLPLPKTEAEMTNAREGKLAMSVGRHFVKDGQRENFQNTFDANRAKLQDYVTEGTIGGGWRVDKEDDKAEWFLMCPWTSVEQHLDFAKTEDFQKYAQIKERLESADVKHAKLLDI